MSDWQPIETAPKNKHLLFFGQQEHSQNDSVTYKGPMIFSGYWDEMDESWCARGSTWEGPFFNPTHWMPLPEPPNMVEELEREGR